MSPQDLALFYGVTQKEAGVALHHSSMNEQEAKDILVEFCELQIKLPDVSVEAAVLSKKLSGKIRAPIAEIQLALRLSHGDFLQAAQALKKRRPLDQAPVHHGDHRDHECFSASGKPHHFWCNVCAKEFKFVPTGEPARIHIEGKKHQHQLRQSRQQPAALQKCVAPTPSVATSAISVVPTFHIRGRMLEREILLKDLQLAVKHGIQSAAGDLWRYSYDGVVYITDPTRRVGITCYRTAVRIAQVTNTTDREPDFSDVILLPPAFAVGQLVGKQQHHLESIEYQTGAKITFRQTRQTHARYVVISSFASMDFNYEACVRAVRRGVLLAKAIITDPKRASYILANLLADSENKMTQVVSTAMCEEAHQDELGLGFAPPTNAKPCE